jgi:hypothetical protein
MSFDEYFDIEDTMDRGDQLVAFIVGLTPAATPLSYLDLKAVDPASGRGPSAGLACQLCDGVAAAVEILKILLDRPLIRPTPEAARGPHRVGDPGHDLRATATATFLGDFRFSLNYACTFVANLVHQQARKAAPICMVLDRPAGADHVLVGRSDLMPASME